MIKTQLSAIIYLKNLKIFIVYFFVIPILDILVMLVIIGNVTNKIDWQVATKSIMISGSILTLESINTMLIDDTNLGISGEMLIKNPYSISYWASKIVLNAIIGEMLIIINSFLLWLVNPHINLINILSLSPIIIVSGLVLGITAFISSWGMSNPYFYSNLIASISYLVSGAVVSITKYPKWLSIISLCFPFRNTLMALTTNKLLNAFYDIPVLVIWLIVGLILYRWKINNIVKTNKFRSVL